MKTFKNLVFTAVLSTFGILTATAQLTNTATANASATIVPSGGLDVGIPFNTQLRHN